MIVVFGIPVLLAVLALVVCYGLYPEHAGSAPAVLSTMAAMIAGLCLAPLLELLIRVFVPVEIIGTSEVREPDRSR